MPPILTRSAGVIKTESQVRNVVNWVQNKRRAVRNIMHHYGPARTFRKFEASAHPATWSRHEELLKWAESQVATKDANEADWLYAESTDPIVRQGFELKQKVTEHYRNLCRECENLRILIHVPPANVSSAYSSLCANFAQSFQFLGIAAQELGWFDETRDVLERFQPTMLLTTDHDGYLSRIDWKAVQDYRKTKPLRVGLNASLQEYGNTPLAERLEWARGQCVDFYYSFRTQQYVRKRYQAILERGYEIFTLEFGANPLLYYPVPGIKRDLNYVFLGSTNPDKWPRYYSHFGPLLKQYPGYIDGPWWSSIARFGDAETHRYICARAKVALNLHIQNQVDWASELNERVYNLAACGVPQLIDDPKLLFERFQPDSFFIARTPAEYQSLFAQILRDPEDAERRAMQAQREVFARHTVFHRAEQFISELSKSRFLKRHQLSA